MMNGYGMGYGAGYAVLMAILWLLLFAGIVLLVLWAVRASQRGAGGTHMYGPPILGRRDEACEVARMRYARGEITRDQYEEMCHVLEGRGQQYTPPPPTNPPMAPTPPAPPAPPTYVPPAPPANPPVNPPSNPPENPNPPMANA